MRLPCLVAALVMPLAAAAAPRHGDLPAPKSKARGEDAAENVNAPRRDARRVEIDLTEGTWMNLDVSPDGTTIAFDLLGDLWTLPIDGGEAVPLTRGPAWDFHPRWSPDGTRLVFSSDRGGMTNAWVVGADGTGARAVTEGDEFYVRTPGWSPDGDYIVARKETGARGGIPPTELWMWHVEGGDGIRLTDKEELHDASGPSFSRDGRFLWFSAREERFSYEPDMTNGLWQVHRVDRRNGERLQVTQGFGGAARPVVSPDGRTLLFVSRRDADTVLVERDLARGSERVLLRSLSRDEMEGFAENDLYPSYAFTPDGAAVVLWSRGRLHRLDLATLQVTPIPFRARSVQWLAPRVTKPERLSDGDVQARILRWPSVSPDGRLVAFDAFGKVWLQSLRAGRPEGEPWRLTREGSGPAREHAPAFSPDGRSLAYVTWSDRDGGHVVRAEVPQPGVAAIPRPITTVAGHYANPAWSPDGGKIAVVRGSGLELRGRQPEEDTWFEAAWLPAEGGEPQYVTSLKLADSLRFHPQVFFSPGGERLFYREPVEPEEEDGDETAQLVSIRLDGTDKRAHLGLPVLGEVVPSPDGRWVAFTSRDNAYVAPLPPVALKEPPAVSLEEGAVPAWRLTETAGSFLRWSSDGSALTWSQGRTLHRLAIADVLAFVAERRAKAEGEDEEKEDEEDDEELELPESDSFDLAVSLPRPQPVGSLLLRGARVVTMRGEEVLARADVLVSGSRIAAVGPSLAAPEGARVVDVAGRTIVPGLIDTHAHLHYSAFEVFPETKWEYAANLAYGVTTIYDPSAPSLDTFAQAEIVEAGLMTGPRITSSGDVLFGGKQTDIWAPVDSQADALRQVRRMKAYGARMIKVYQQGRRDQRLWFAEACRKEGMLLTAEGAGELMTDLTLALDGYTALEHALPVEIFDDVVQLLARSGTHYTPTLLVAYGGPPGEAWYWQHESPHDDEKLGRFTPHRALDRLGRRRMWIHPEEYHFPTIARGVAEVLRAGGNVSMGAHGQLQGLGVLWEVRAMTGEGALGVPASSFLTRAEALRASTILAADKIGLAQDLGSIEAGKKADLLVLRGDPLADLRALADAEWVVKDGRLYDAATLSEEWPDPRPLPPFSWTGRDR